MIRNVLFTVFVSVCLLTQAVNAHFQVVIPSTDMVEKNDSRKVGFDLMFMHPFENTYMNMSKPLEFKVFNRGKTTDLKEKLKQSKKDDFSVFRMDFTVTRPGDHIFYVIPAPYWEPVEGCFIQHYTKVLVNAFGMEDAWDKELGLKAEIVPLVRPYGIWAGNLFRGIVKFNGKPVPFAEIEVEYYNPEKDVAAPTGCFITQIIKADKNGVFSYAVPKAGWWGFAALLEGDKKIKHSNGKKYPVEIGALIWIKAYQMK